MDKIIEGVQQFSSKVFPQQQAMFEELKAGQKPLALMITCSDSRIDPNLITQTGPGELFVIRNAGNLVPPYGAGESGVEGTIEYAIKALNIRDIIVCGHSQCGAVTATVQNSSNLSEQMPAVARWLWHAGATQQVVRAKYPNLTGEALIGQAARENVLMQIENLQTHPPVAAQLAQKQLRLHAWMYHFESGTVEAYNPSTGQFEAINAVSGAANTGDTAAA